MAFNLNTEDNKIQVDLTEGDIEGEGETEVDQPPISGVEQQNVDDTEEIEDEEDEEGFTEKEMNEIFKKRSFVGVDLGTTYYCVASVEVGYEIVIIEDPSGAKTTPSAITFVADDNGEIGQTIYGEEALDRKGTKKKNELCVYDWKRILGRRYVPYIYLKYCDL